jgi:hypothetical protein
VVLTARVDIHNAITEFPEQIPLQRLGEELCQHFYRGTVFQSDLPRIHFVFGVEVLYVDMFGAFAAGCLAVSF